MDIHWFIPTHGDSRFLGTPIGKRVTHTAYLQQIAAALDALGYTGALLPTGQICEDSWVVAASLAAVTQRMKFLIAVRPGSIDVTLAARMTVTLDRLSNGRLLLNIITGGDPVELAGDGTFLKHDERYAVTDEFLTVWKALFAGGPANYQGQYIHVKDVRLNLPPVQQPYPPLYFGGSSPAAMSVAARHIDLYLTHAEPPQDVAQKIAELRRHAVAQGREVRIGVRAHVVVRETEAEAWAAAREMLRYVTDDMIADAQKKLERFDSVGQARMVALHGGSRDQLEVYPNLWAGFGLINKGIGTAIVGSADQVAERLMEYASLGADCFILSGYPHLEEAYRVAELVFPRIPGWRGS